MTIAELLKERYAYIFEEALQKEIVDVAQLKKVPKGMPMIDIGDEITHMPLILEGAIRIMQEDKDEHEYLLYYLEMGDSCAMTMNCCMRGKSSNIRAVAESPTILLMIPIHKMEEWLVKYRSWRVYVFESYDSRMSEMLEAIDALAFHNMEERLYKYLKNKAMVTHNPELEITHYQIANDLNTSRVVISRLVKKLIIDQKIETHRNHITVLELLPKNRQA